MGSRTGEAGLGRRTFLAAATAAMLLPGRGWAAQAEPLAAILAGSGLGAATGFALCDGGTGEILESHRSDHPLPPASVVKIFTALQALELLGPNYRFQTRLIPTGVVSRGVLTGDLVLSGSGDPLLDTDQLGALAQGLHGRGISAVAGRFRVATGALPSIAEIEPGQPDEAGYNPAIAGLNLNFNRVHLAWEPGSTGPAAQFSAPGTRFLAPVPSIGLEFNARARAPRHSIVGKREVWAMAPASLRGRGSIWLPVREPANYAGEVFRTLTAQAGTSLQSAEVEHGGVEGSALITHTGEPLHDIMRGMLFHSTNLTAEVVGLRAAQATGSTPAGLAESAGTMADWARTRLGLEGAVFVNHSGLTDRSQVTAAGVARALVRAQVLGLPDLLRERPVRDATRKPLDLDGIRVLAKTGTLDFVSALAGYIEGRSGRHLTFAILAADPAARAAIPPERRADPPGAAAFAARARAQEQALLRRWAARNAA